MAFKNVTYFGHASPLDQVEQNVMWFLKDGLLQVGAYYNINGSFVGYDGEQLAYLYPSYQSEHGRFQFWRGQSHQWVWESGISVGGPIVSPPIAVSGVYVSGAFYPTATTTGVYEHYVDYNRGGIVFSSPRASGLNLECHRTERAAFVYSAHSDEYRRISYNHLRAVKSPPGSGVDTVSPENKSFLPAIFITVKRGEARPYELGDLVQWTNYNLAFDVMAQSTSDFHRLRDICLGLEEHAFTMFNVNQAAASGGGYPLDYLGRLRDSAETYTSLKTNYPWKIGRFTGPTYEEIIPQALPLHRARIVMGFELVL
jgi:hypothetical protein